MSLIHTHTYVNQPQLWARAQRRQRPLPLRLPCDHGLPRLCQGQEVRAGHEHGPVLVHRHASGPGVPGQRQAVCRRLQGLRPQVRYSCGCCCSHTRRVLFAVFRPTRSPGTPLARPPAADSCGCCCSHTRRVLFAVFRPTRSPGTPLARPPAADSCGCCCSHTRRVLFAVFRPTRSPGTPLARPPAASRQPPPPPPPPRPPPDHAQ